MVKIKINDNYIVKTDRYNLALFRKRTAKDPKIPKDDDKFIEPGYAVVGYFNPHSFMELSKHMINDAILNKLECANDALTLKSLSGIIDKTTKKFIVKTKIEEMINAEDNETDVEALLAENKSLKMQLGRLKAKLGKKL